jgi:hypothetical protein
MAWRGYARMMGEVRLFVLFLDGRESLGITSRLNGRGVFTLTVNV